MTRDAAGKAVEVAKEAKERVGQNPHVATAAEKTRDAVDRTVGAARDAARDQAEQHPRVAATVERTAGTGGKTARAVGQQARRHPRFAGGLVASSAVFLTVRRKLRGRRRSEASR
jgi:hypothetical protein